MSKTPTSPPTSPRRGKLLACNVYMLDDTTLVFHMPQKCPGQGLMHEVAKKINLFELDYFDLEYKDEEGNMCWLDHEKPLVKQLPANHLNFKFLVKFYTPDPGLLEDEFTRYLFALQVKRDLATGVLACQEHTAVLLASYIVQADLGDFTEEQFPDHRYLSQCKLLPKQTEDIQIKIMEHHKEHLGQSPAEADFNLLDTARKVEMYGIRLHSAKDHEGVPLHLAVAHMGVLVFQNFTKINTFSWAKIRKLSFKRKKFLIKLHPEGYAGYYKDTVEFYLDSRNQCKNFWKKCIEHHAFFRCHHVKRQPRNKTRVMSRGSSFRYSGRTQKQLVEFVREHYTKRAPFERKDKVVSTKAKPNNIKGLRRNPSPKHKQSNKNRSTSMRTVSSTTENRSAGATPKTATLNSRDVQFGMLNTSASSGSHTLDMDNSRDNTMDHSGNKYESDHHDNSVHMHTGTSSFRSSKEQEYNRTSNMNYEKGNYSYQEDRREAQDIDQPFTGACENNSNSFNYNYYQLSYDGMGAHDVLANQNAHEFTYDEDDNISHDSYRLTSSSRDDSLERELDRYDIPNTVLHIDEEKLLRELEAEKQVVVRGAQKAVSGTGGGDNKDVFLEIADELNESINQQNQMSAENKSYVVSYQQTIIKDNLIKSSVENLELEVVGVLDSYCRSDSKEQSNITAADTETIPDQIARNKAVSNDNISPEEDQKGRESLKAHTEQNNIVDDVNDTSKVEDDLYNHNVNSDMNLCDRKSVNNELDENHEQYEGKKTENNSSKIEESLIDEIPYVLHKRHVSSERKTPSTLPKPRSRSKTPSPSRQMSVPLTRKQHRAQLEKLKTSLTSPLSPPKSPVGKPRSASPHSRRTFDFVTYNKLPPCDSYSTKDDSLSPSKENEFVLLADKANKEEDDTIKDDSHGTKNIENGSVSLDVEIEKEIVKKSGVENISSAMKSTNGIDTDIGNKTISEDLQEKQCHRILQIQKFDTFSISSESDVEYGNESHDSVDLLGVDDDVNVILSECGEDEPDDSSASSSGIIESSPRLQSSESIKDQLESSVISKPDDGAIKEVPQCKILEGSKNEGISFDEGSFLDNVAAIPEKIPGEEAYIDMQNKVSVINDNEVMTEDTKIQAQIPSEETCINMQDKETGIIDDLKNTEAPIETPSDISEDFPLPPPPPSPQQVSLEELSSPDIPPPEVPIINLLSPGGGEMKEFLGSEDSNVQGIPSIVIRSATPLPPGGSSSGEESSSFVEDEVPVVIPKTKRDVRARNKQRSGSLSSTSSSDDLPPPPPSAIPKATTTKHMVVSSDDDVELGDEHDLQSFAAALASQAQANPFSQPVCSEAVIPGALVHDVSSESDSDVAKPDLSDYQDAAHLLEAEAAANPFAKIISGDQYFPSAPDHDVSSDYDSDESGLIGDDSELFSAQQYLESQVTANPFSVPRTGNELLPPPEHDVSSESESDVLNLDASELVNARSVLDSQAMANPFSVPLSGPSVYLPPPPPIDSDSSSDSAANDADEEDLPDPADILEGEVMENPYLNFNNRNLLHDEFLPPPLPPPRVESISNGAFNQAAKNNQNLEDLPPPPPSPPLNEERSNFQDIVGKASMQSSSSSSSFEQMGQQIVEAEPLDALEKLNNPSLMQYSSESSSDNDTPRVTHRTLSDFAQSDRTQSSALDESSLVMGNPMAEETDLFVNPYAQEISGNGGSSRNRRVPPPTKPKPKMDL